MSDVPDPGPAPDDQLYSKKYVEDLRRENKRYREGYESRENELTELRSYREKADRDRSAADERYKTEIETERGARATAEATAKTALDAAHARLIRAEVRALAVAAGIEDPDDIGLMDLSGIALDGDAVKGAAEAVEAFRVAKPHKFRPRGLRVDKTQTPAPSGKPGDLDARDLSDADFRALEASLRSGKH